MSKKALSKETLKSYRKASDDLRFDEGYNNIGKLNLAAYLGERAHYMLDTIEVLQDLLSEWLHDGRFLVANCPEQKDLIERTKEAIEQEGGETDE